MQRAAARHRLADKVRDQRDGTMIAVCRCGWRSVPASEGAALSAMRAHLRRWLGSAMRAA